MFELAPEVVAAVAPDELHDIQVWLDDLSLVAASDNKEQTKRIVAQKHNCSISKVTQKYYGVRKHGARFLVDGRRARRGSTSTGGHRSPQFRQWVHSLYYQVKRSQATPTVQRLMLDALAQWENDPGNPSLAIPGYDAPPPRSKASRYRYPTGWSLRNLNQIKPDAYQIALGRKGPHAARELLPGYYTTRVGLHVGEVYMLDDQYLDNLVHYGDKLVRPIGLNILDLFSGCDVERILRPMLKDEEDGNKALNQKDAIWLAVSLLTFIGFHPERCRLVAESGAATYGDFFGNGIKIITDGRVLVETGEVSKAEVAGLRMIAKGNPRFKAARESWFKILRNRMGALPMQTGANSRIDKPESTERLEQEENALLRDFGKLPPEVQRALHPEIEAMPWADFSRAYWHICETINRRRNHRLQGWEELGFEFTEYRLGDQWIDSDEYLDLAPETRALINDRMRRGEVVSRISRKSPREVFHHDAPSLEKINPFRWHYIVPGELAIRAKIPTNRTLKIERREYGPGTLLFEAEFHTENGERRPLQIGQKVIVYLNPLRPDFALLCDQQNGKAIGIVFAIQRGPRTDRETMLECFSQRRRIESQIGGTATRHNEQLAQERNARRERNNAVLEAHGIRRKKRSKKRPDSSSRNGSGNALETIDIPAPKSLRGPNTETDQDETHNDDFLDFL